MLFTHILTIFALIVAPILATPAPKSVNVTYSTQYDKKAESLVGVACSNGSNGLLTKGFTTYGSLKAFPFIAGASAIAGWNSPECGTCWQLTYKGTSINVLAIDHCADGFNLSEEAMNKLTGGEAVDLGHVQATVVQLPASSCGM